jgi:hypothetical protein
VLDGRAEWDAGKVTLFAFAHNLLDKTYFTTLSVAMPVSGRPLVSTLGNPSEIGIGVESRF